MSRKMTGIVKTFDRKSGKGFIIPSDGRKEVQVHISAFTPRDAEVLIPGLRVEFCRVNGLRGPTAANGLFVLMESARWYACFIHDLRKTCQRTHALRISLFTSCQGQFHLSGRRI